MIGNSSVLVTLFPSATFLVPFGARNGGRGLPKGFSRLGTDKFVGVPTNIGSGSSILIGSISCPLINDRLNNIENNPNKNFFVIIKFFLNFL